MPHHHRDRICQKLLGALHANEGPTALRLLGRDTGPRPVRTVLGPRNHHRPVRIRAIRQLPECGPNAPLLKRIVKFPFALGTTRPRRAVFRKSARGLLPVRSKPQNPMPASCALVGKPTGGRVAFAKHRPVRRPRPSAQDWLTKVTN